MKKATLTLILILCILPLNAQDSAKERRIRQTVNEMMDNMTTEQKVAQLFMVQIDRNNPAEIRAEQDSLVKLGLGGIIIMRGPVVPFMERMNELQSASRIPLLVATDAEWGAAMRFYEYKAYPKQYQLSKMKNSAGLMYKMGRNVAKELKDLNIHVNFAPVADMVEVPGENADQREFGFGVAHATEYATAYMKGMQDEGLSACAKHFPSHGETNIDAHIERPYFYYTREHADSTYLVPFKKMIDEGVDFVMMGHHAVQCYDSTMIACSISPKCVKGVLKGELGFKGLVVTDALGMGGVMNGSTPLEVNVAAYKAGIDLLLMSQEPIQAIKAITDSLECGAFPMDELDERVRKMLTLKARKGFFESGYSPIVTDIQDKIDRANKRDAALIEKMNKRIFAYDPYENAPYHDPTLQMDRGRN